MMKKEPRDGNFLGRIMENDSQMAMFLNWFGHKFTNSMSTVQNASICTPAPTTSSHVLYILVFHTLHPITKLYGKELFGVWRVYYVRV